ncbi:MAG: TolC family protein [Opitutaceae bacterium]|jgi:outer membrane protein TolC
MISDPGIAFQRPKGLTRILALCAALAAASLACAAAETAPEDAPLTLDQAIRLALAKNYTIRVQSYEVPIAQAAVTEALGRFDAKLSGSTNDSRDELPNLLNPLSGARPPATVTDTDTYSLALAGSIPGGLGYSIGASTTNARGTSNLFSDTYTSFAGVTLTQPLLRDFGLGTSLAQVRIARTNRAISEWDYRQTVIDTVTQVAYAYSDFQLAQAYLRSAIRSYESAQQLEKENERRFSVGERSEYDITSAKAEVASRQESVFAAQRYVSLAENAFNQLISDQKNPDLLKGRISLAPLPLDEPLRIDPAADFRTALEKRPDYLKALLSIKRGKIEKNYQLNQLLPRVDLVGSYGYNGLAGDYHNSRRDIRNQDFPSYSAGVNVTVPITSSTERGRYRAAKIRLQQAELMLERMEQDIVVQVGNAAVQLENTRKRVEATRSARELYDKLVEAEIKRLRAGTGSTFNVLYQQRYLSQAEISEAQAQSDYFKARADYDRQLGRTLEVNRIALAEK